MSKEPAITSTTETLETPRDGAQRVAIANSWTDFFVALDLSTGNRIDKVVATRTGYEQEVNDWFLTWFNSPKNLFNVKIGFIVIGGRANAIDRAFPFESIMRWRSAFEALFDEALFNAASQSPEPIVRSLTASDTSADFWAIVIADKMSVKLAAKFSSLINYMDRQRTILTLAELGSTSNASKDEYDEIADRIRIRSRYGIRQSKFVDGTENNEYNKKKSGTNLETESGDVVGNDGERSGESSESDRSSDSILHDIARLVTIEHTHRAAQISGMLDVLKSLSHKSQQLTPTATVNIAAELNHALDEAGLSLVTDGRAWRFKVYPDGTAHDSRSWVLATTGESGDEVIRSITDSELKLFNVEPLRRGVSWATKEEQRRVNQSALAEKSQADANTSFGAFVASLQVSKANAAQQLLEPLKSQLKTMPSGSYEDKKNICKLVNNVLGKFGLAVRCPRSGEPSYLVAGVSRKTSSSFQFSHQDQAGKSVRSFSTTQIDVILKVIELIPGNETKAKWRRYAKRPNSESTRLPDK